MNSYVKQEIETQLSDLKTEVAEKQSLMTTELEEQTAIHENLLAQVNEDENLAEEVDYVAAIEMNLALYA